MTFRSRTPARPTRRRTHQADTRRSIYMNVAFGLAVVAAIVVLGGVVFSYWYSDHWAPVSTVNGQSINKDAVRDRAAVDLARYDRQLRTYGQLRNQGVITSDEYTNLQSSLTSNEVPATLFANALTELQNDAILQQYADKNGISVTDAQVTSQIDQDSTIPEMRHVMVIGVAPVPTAPATVPSSADILAALTKTQTYLADIKSGAKKWADVATASGETSTSTGVGGDFGLTTKDGLSLDPDLVDAIFGLAKKDDVTAIFKGTDGVYRFATVTEIVPTSKDSGWLDAIKGAAKEDAYRSAAHGAAIKQAIKDKVDNQYIKSPTTQRKVQEIALSPGYGQPYDATTGTPADGDEVKVRLMVFAPNHSPSGAASVAATDPAWTDAKNRAQAAVDKLKNDPSQFDAMAKDTTSNDDANFASQGGEAPWLPESLFGTGSSAQQGLGYTTVGTDVFKAGLTDNTILGPIQEPSSGYVVVEFMGRRPSPSQRIADMALQIALGSDFTTIASTQSESSDASNGGDMGWVSPYMLSKQMQGTIFSTPVGQVSGIVTSTTQTTDASTGAPVTKVTGYWLFKVGAEETRTADAAQQQRLEKVVFPAWVDDLYAAAQVTTDQVALTALSTGSTAAASNT